MFSRNCFAALAQEAMVKLSVCSNVSRNKTQIYTGSTTTHGGNIPLL